MVGGNWLTGLKGGGKQLLVKLKNSHELGLQELILGSMLFNSS